jgi:superfamily II DNA or RNA helicase
MSLIIKPSDKIILGDVLYVPSHFVNSDIRDAWTYKFKKKIYERVSGGRVCQNCKWWTSPWYKDKENCSDLGYQNVCNDFEYQQVTRIEEEILTTYRQISPNMVIFGRGNLEKIEKYFGAFDIEDRRSAPVLGWDLRCNATLRPDQQKAADELLDKYYGILKAPPGWGKSVLFCWVLAKIGLRTIVLSQETRHLQVCIDALYQHTNLKELEEDSGEHILGTFGEEFCNKKDRDYVRKNKDLIYPIMFATYQSFNSEKGKQALEKFKNSYGLLWIEEVHHESAKTYHEAAREFNTWVRMGATATPTRKDKTHVAIYDTVGPVTVIATGEQMVPVISWIHTGIEIPKWVFQCQYATSKLHTYLADNSEYRDIVLKYFMKDIEDGRKPLLITERKSLAFWLVDQIKISGYKPVLAMGGVKNKGKKGENYEEIIKGLLNGNIHGVIGTKVLKENINIPPLDVLHLPFPNFGKELEEQMIGRIRRYLKNEKGDNIPDAKPTPIVRIYTYVADNKLPTSALNFRKSLYKSWKFETLEEIEENPAPEIVKNQRPRTLRTEI